MIHVCGCGSTSCLTMQPARCGLSLKNARGQGRHEKLAAHSLPGRRGRLAVPVEYLVRPEISAQVEKTHRLYVIGRCSNIASLAGDGECACDSFLQFLKRRKTKAGAARYPKGGMVRADRYTRSPCGRTTMQN